VTSVQQFGRPFVPRLCGGGVGVSDARIGGQRSRLLFLGSAQIARLFVAYNEALKEEEEPG
jgi:hypothetical protein